MKRAILWIVVALIIIAAIWGIVSSTKDTTTTRQGDLATSVTTEDHISGTPDAKVILVEYSDFECPACASYFPLIKQVKQEFGNDVAFVYRHFPLPQHKHAELAAVMSEAAARQGKFWEMHDLLFLRQSEWGNNPAAQGFFVSYIQSLGLDVDKFKADVTDKVLETKVRNSYKDGVKSGVEGTPTFYLNGKLIKNPRTIEDFRTIIKAELAAVGGSSATTTATSTQSVTR